MMFRVLPNGRVGTCDIEPSSGSELPDATSCALLKMRGRYTPELDSRGRAIESRTRTQQFVWQIPDDDPALAEAEFGVPFRLKIQVDVDVAGKRVDCHTVTRTGSVPPGDACRDVLERPDIAPLVRAGKAVPSRMTLLTTLARAPR